MYVVIFILGMMLGGMLAFCFFCMFSINRNEKQDEELLTSKNRGEGGNFEDSERK